MRLIMWTPAIRLIGFGRYMVNIQGRRSDDWLVGGGIAIFSK